MTAPAVHPTTTSTYELLPLAYRDADARLDWPLLRWLSLLLDQIGDITDVIDAIDVRTPDEGGAVGDASALTDPETAQEEWLPWLAQFVGIGLATPAGADLRGFGHGLFGSGYFGGVGNPSGIADLRTAIRTRTFARGTKATITAIAQRYLLPDSPVHITERVGDRWHYSVHVYSSHVLDEGGLTRALEAENPAGMVLTLLIGAGSYADLADSMAGGTYADFPTTFADYQAIKDFEP